MKHSLIFSTSENPSDSIYTKINCICWLTYIHLVVYLMTFCWETRLFVSLSQRQWFKSSSMSCNLSKLWNLSVSSSLQWWQNTRSKGKTKQEKAYYNLYSPFSLTFTLPHSSPITSHLRTAQPFQFISESPSPILIPPDQLLFSLQILDHKASSPNYFVVPYSFRGHLLKCLIKMLPVN